jgi:hypothetical protein
VEAKVAGSQRYRDGEVVSVNNDGTYDIRFADGEEKRRVRSKQMRSADDRRDSGRKKNRRKSVGDTVEAKCRGWKRYQMGKITRVNRDGTYDVTFDDGEQTSGVTPEQIRGGRGGGVTPTTDVNGVIVTVITTATVTTTVAIATSNAATR